MVFSGISIPILWTKIFHADMKIRRYRKVLFLIILILGMCCLWRLWLFFEDDLDENAEEFFIMLHSIPPKVIGKKLPFHQIYEPRKVKYPTNLQEKPVYSDKTKIILLWTPWNGVKKTINYYSLLRGNRSFARAKCPNQKCFTTYNRKYLQKADAVLFHLLDTKSSDLPSYRSAQQLWILYNMEPPWLIKKHLHPDLPNLKGVFNWTMSYRSNSDVIARYGFIAPSNENRIYMPLHNKTKSVVWFVSDCDTGSKREDYARELNKYIDVDVYGTCGDHKCYPSQSSTCYENVLKEYKFYLSFENAICKDYITEKFFNVFNYDIIPIVFGGANYSSIIPRGTYIDATKYPSPRRLAFRLERISRNEKLYRSFLLNKKSFTAYLDPWMCRLCDKLHSNNKPSILKDVEEWWLKEAQCKTWDRGKKKFMNSIV